ncbi:MULTISPECIES: CaiB/BaiF CoA-transferase family protein [unclassified Pseudofrankia]|uniref:CaiB/BaiF CoA transferase family protein n=1 Tax=unclassified Pseudofrankia TaxID=2994372 RepID=UPI0008D99799|nr:MULTISPECIES: CoA transferase [unclassified Pseudofrankia]MDT3446552.1 CoA transferase [Pseudofrankia sp. BMG5.37]OHV58703.1 carnitine dehydratase [Pseudofrankia sp. BMG5.36]
MNETDGRDATPYTGLVVVELADDLAGEQAGKQLAELGADVIKVETPEGSRSRRTGPFAKDVVGVDTSLTFWTYNAGKRSVILDGSDSGRAALRALIAKADVLLATLRPSELAEAGLDYQQLLETHPRLIVLSVTPFGLEGPWADYRTSDLVGLAAGGPLMSCGYDDHSIPPIRPGGNQGYQTAASFAHCGLLLALIERQQTGVGQLVDVSMHCSLAVSGELANPYWFYPKVLVQRQTSRHAQPEMTQPALFRCADDRWIYFALILAEQKPWEALVEWMDSLGLAVDLTDAEYSNLTHRQQNFHHVQDLIEVFFLLMDSAAAYHEGQRRGLPIGPVQAPEDLFDDPHLAARNFFAPVSGDEGVTALVPTSPFRFSSFDVPSPRRAPRLGEDTAEILADLGEAQHRGIPG